MKQLNIKTYYGDASNDHLKTVSGDIASHCTSNSNFTFAGTSFTDFKTAQGNWVTGLTAASTGDPAKEADALALRKLMEPMLTDICNQVNTQAKHDKSKLLSSGGEVTSAGGSVGIFSAPVIKKVVTSLAPGTMEVTLETESRALGTMITMVDVATNESKTWFVAQKHILMITGLTPGKEYSFSFAWVGTNMTLVYSSPINKFAQK